MSHLNITVLCDLLFYLCGPHADTSGVQQQNKELLDHIWVPELYIPHQKLVKCSHGLPFYQQKINFLVKAENIWVDFWTLVKPTITCPMVFNWFPFDQQYCNVFIQVEKMDIGYFGLTDLNGIQHG